MCFTTVRINDLYMALLQYTLHNVPESVEDLGFYIISNNCIKRCQMRSWNLQVVMPSLYRNRIWWHTASIVHFYVLHDIIKYESLQEYDMIRRFSGILNYLFYFTAIYVEPSTLPCCKYRS